MKGESPLGRFCAINIAYVYRIRFPCTDYVNQNNRIVYVPQLRECVYFATYAKRFPCSISEMFLRPLSLLYKITPLGGLPDRSQRFPNFIGAPKQKRKKCLTICSRVQNIFRHVRKSYWGKKIDKTMKIPRNCVHCAIALYSYGL